MQYSAHKMLKIAKVLKSNGTEGEIIISFHGISPEDIDIKEPVFVHVDELPVPFFFESFIRKGTGKAAVRMTGIRSAEDADEFAGADIYADIDSLDIDYDNDDFSLLDGWTLTDSNGNRKGTISGFLDIPNNPCIEVSSDTGEVIVPLHEDLIVNTDPDKRVIRMQIPEGLF